jgi:hypothetical protein
MSYTQRYHDSITVSGSKTVSYPKSESGGTQTVHYSETVPLDITINVLTQPFDDSVSNTNRSIDMLTGAVVAMNAAQCAAITQSSKEVSTHIIDGFFGTIKSELSQQIQALDSAIKAGFGLIAEQGKAISAQKETVEADYYRISSRYTTLFQDIDDECYKRIYALDKQSFKLCENSGEKLLCETTSNAAAKSLLEIEEESASKNMLAVSGMTRKTRDVLKTLHDYITQETQISTLINSFLYEETVENNSDLFIPVIFFESSNTAAKSNVQDCALQNFISDADKKIISKKLIDFAVKTPNNRWVKMQDEEKTALDKELNSLCEAQFSGSDEIQNRVYKTMINLWQNSDLQLIKG